MDSQKVLLKGMDKMRPLRSVLILVSLVLVLAACSNNKIEKSQQEVRQEKVEKAKKQVEKKIKDKSSEESSANELKPDNADSNESETASEEQTNDQSELAEQIEETRKRGRFMAQGQEIPAPKDVPPIIEKLIMDGNDVYTMIDTHFGYRLFETTDGDLYIIETELTTDEGHANFEKMCRSDPSKCFADGNYLVYKEK